MKRRSDYVFTELGHHADDCVMVIQQYLDFLVQGDGRKAHCPLPGQCWKSVCSTTIQAIYSCIRRNFSGL